MIDWELSGLSKSEAKNKDRVITICEKCGSRKEVSYLVSKRRQEHLCMSCIKKQGEYSEGELVTYKCGCGLEKEQPYSLKRWTNWKCHHCAMVQGHKDGKFTVYRGGPSEEGKKRISEAAKKNWQNPEYLKKWKASRDKTKEARSIKSKEIWADKDRRKKLCQKLRSPESLEKRALARAKQPRSNTSIQLLLYEFLDDLGADYYAEGLDTKIGYYVFDCLVKTPDGKRDVLIECQGDYWHTLDKAIANDKSKFTYIDRYFPDYEIMYVWEHEFYTKDRVLDRLKSKLGVDIESVDFDFKNIQILKPDTKQLRSFLDAYHYIGKGRGGKCFGAYLNGELIACCVFSSPLRQNTANFFGTTDECIRELSRFCIHPSYHKKNFASWFVSRCIKAIDTDLIIAYADTTVGHDGTIYKASNFKLHHTVPSDYWYVDGDGYVMHKRTLYGKAVKMKMKEAEFATKNGYIRKYGGDKLCYLYSHS